MLTVTLLYQLKTVQNCSIEFLSFVALTMMAYNCSCCKNHSYVILYKGNSFCDILTSSKMIQCSICSKRFANKRSLSSHKHRYHKNSTSTKGEEKTKTEIINSFEKVNSENYDSLSNTDEDTGKEVLSDSVDNHSTDSNVGAKKSESHDGEWAADYSSEDKNTLDYKNFDTDNDYSSATIKSEKCKKIKLSSESSEDESSNLSLMEESHLDHESCVKQSKFVKLLCKSILNGTLKLHEQHIQLLKPIRGTVRNIANSTLRDSRRIIEREVRRDKKNGNFDLCTILKTIIPLINDLIW